MSVSLVLLRFKDHQVRGREKVGLGGRYQMTQGPARGCAASEFRCCLSLGGTGNHFIVLSNRVKNIRFSVLKERLTGKSLSGRLFRKLLRKSWGRSYSLN